MATLEQVERLRERANVTYDEAKEALQACGDDLLDALIYLEKQGKAIPPQNGGQYSSRQEVPGKDKNGEQYTGEDDESIHHGENLGQMFQRFWRWFCQILRRSNTNYFNVWSKNKRVATIPVTVLVLLILFFFWFVVPLLVVGLFFGFRYRFSGPDLGKPGVNKIIDTAADAAEQFKNEVIHGADASEEKKVDLNKDK